MNIRIPDNVNKERKEALRILAMRLNSAYDELKMAYEAITDYPELEKTRKEIADNCLDLKIGAEILEDYLEG